MAEPEETGSFERRFMDSVGKPIEFEGVPVHAIYRRELEPGTLIEVEFVGARERPAQGLELRVDDGLLTWRERELRARSLQVWAADDRAAAIEYTTRRPTRLHVWNVWREALDGEPMVQAWRAWSGMRVEIEPAGVLLHCSGNAEAASFEDLVVRLRFREA